jgi:cell division protein FtsN
MTRRRSRQSPSRQSSSRQQGAYRTLLRRSDVDNSRALPRLMMASGVIGGAFALGLLFGDAATTDGTSALDGGLAKIDEMTGEYEEVREKLRLTFHQELTEAEKAVEASRVRRDQVASGMRDALPVLNAADNPLESKPAPAEPHADQPTTPDKHEVKAAQAAPTPAAKTAQITEPSESAPEVDDDEREPAKPEVVAGSRKRLASALSSLFGDETPDWAQKVNKTSAPPSQEAAKAQAPAPKPATAVAKAPAAGRYYLQVASSPNAEAADRLRGKLAADGHPASVVLADVDGRTMHRVVITGFTDQATAGRARDKVASTHGLKGLVRSAH